MDQRTDKRFAMLIDTDNISPRQIETILGEIRKRGVPMIRRAYGDWSKLSKDWKDALLPNAIIPVQQYAYTPGKNATDFALVIDAMDILHRNLVEGFAIVSSDSDFTPLALRLREAGKDVIGIGENKAPAPFREACNPFVEIGPPPSPKAVPAPKDPAPISTPSTPKPSAQPAPTPAKIKQIAAIVRELNAKEGSACLLSTLGSHLTERKIDTKPFASLQKFLKACPDQFLLNGAGPSIRVRTKEP